MAVDTSQLRARGIYEAQVPLATLPQDLDRIDGIVKGIQGRRKQMRWLALLLFLFGLGSIIAGAILGNYVLALAGPSAIPLCFALFIYSFFYGGRLTKNADRLALTRELTKTLQHDANPQSTFKVRLALKGNPKQVKEEPWAARPSGKQVLLEEDIVSVEGALLDGTSLSEVVTEFTRKRTHRNRNGKTKIKIRSRYLVNVRLAYDDAVYGDARSASAALNEQIQVPPAATLREARVTEKAIVLKALTGMNEDIVRTSAMLSLGAYRILNLSRRAMPAGSGGQKSGGQK